MTTVHTVVIGGGIAGVAAAYYLSEQVEIILVEQESSLAYHTTGRSAALFLGNLGEASMRVLSEASLAFLADPPSGLADGPLMAAPSGALIVGRAGQRHLVEEAAEAGRLLDPTVRVVGPAEALEMVPVLRPDHAQAAVWEPSAADLDVAMIHQAFVRGLRNNGGRIRLSSPVTDLRQGTSGWEVRAGGDTLHCSVVVNAAGAWGDVVAKLAGVEPVGLQPRRRTVFMSPAPDGARRWPLVANVGYEYYFKPDGTQLLCSLADETPSEPCDARPVDLDIALAIDRINQATTLDLTTVRSSWAGLRTFSPDEDLVIGFDPEADGFFWLVGQGGTGIQTSPAAGRLAAQLIVRDGGWECESGSDDLIRAVDPGRFRI